MNLKFYVVILLINSMIACKNQTHKMEDQVIDFSTIKTAENTIMRFDISKDLLLAHFDCKTDVDDLHSVAALATLLNHPLYKKVNYHAVAGTYGAQGGLYVPANELFQLSFGDRWTDAHADLNTALEDVNGIAAEILGADGDIWIAEAGQSDFSAYLIDAFLVQFPDLDLKKRVHLVQHSNWNEEATTPERLTFAQAKVDYIKIADGNVVGNGTPGFKDPNLEDLKANITDPNLRKIWDLAISKGNQYNGKEARYLNKVIAEGGLDFSDLVEACWIFGLEELPDVEAFYTYCKSGI